VMASISYRIVPLRRKGALAPADLALGA